MNVFPNGEHGKHAVSHYKVLERFGYTTLIECKLETGRTHQIRVHCKEFGFSIFGDELYGGGIKKSKEFMKDTRKELENYFLSVQGHCLHANSIEFEHPSTSKKVKFSVEPDNNFNAIYQSILNDEI